MLIATVYLKCLFQVVNQNSTENATFNDFCSLKIIQLIHGKHF